MRVLFRVEDAGAFPNGPGQALLPQLLRRRLGDEAAAPPLAHKLVNAFY
jgi:hypothetical protein